MVNFDVSISIKNRLDAPDLIFDISAPEDGTVENELQRSRGMNCPDGIYMCYPDSLPELHYYLV